MVYRVFISTTADKQTTDYITAVQHTLWQLKDFPVAPTTMEDLALTEGEPEALIRHTLDETDIFVGIYGSSFGEYMHLNVADLVEYEYSYAIERGLKPLIFLSDEENVTDERMKDFRDMIRKRQIVHPFVDVEELRAKLIVAITNFRSHARTFPKMQLPPNSLAAVSEDVDVPDDLFEFQVQRAFQIVEDDIENLVQRALAVQEAKTMLDVPATNGTGHEIMVNPIFGEPNKNVQFQSDIFMIMPFREEYDSVYQSVILPTVAELNLTIKRGDEFSTVSGQIMSEVWAALNACKLVIVETSLENANVYYELGIAHTLGKPAILITQAKEIEDFPFDIRHHRFIVYENTIPGGEKLEEELKKSIIWIMNDLEDGE